MIELVLWRAVCGDAARVTDGVTLIKSSALLSDGNPLVVLHTPVSCAQVQEATPMPDGVNYTHSTTWSAPLPFRVSRFRRPFSYYGGKTRCRVCSRHERMPEVIASPVTALTCAHWLRTRAATNCMHRMTLIARMKCFAAAGPITLRDPAQVFGIELGLILGSISIDVLMLLDRTRGVDQFLTGQWEVPAPTCLATWSHVLRPAIHVMAPTQAQAPVTPGRRPHSCTCMWHSPAGSPAIVGVHCADREFGIPSCALLHAAAAARCHATLHPCRSPSTCRISLCVQLCVGVGIATHGRYGDLYLGCPVPVIGAAQAGSHATVCAVLCCDCGVCACSGCLMCCVYQRRGRRTKNAGPVTGAQSERSLKSQSRWGTHAGPHGSRRKVDAAARAHPAGARARRPH